MKIALAQINSILGNVEKNIEIHIKYCEEAIGKKADVIVFPELSLTGYSLKDLNLEVALNLSLSSKLDKLKELSKNIDIVCGFVEESDSYALYNSSAYFSGGEIVHTHQKVYPPTYTLFEEFKLGNTKISVEVVNFLRDWLMNHIAIEDKRIGVFANSN